MGWEVVCPGPDEPDVLHPEWISVRPPNVAEVGFSLGFQRVDNYRAPVWPDGPVPQQEHIDFCVESIPDAEKVAVALRAVRAGYQPGEAGGAKDSSSSRTRWGTRSASAGRERMSTYRYPA